MKKIAQIFFGLSLLTAASSCKKYKALDYEVQKPETVVLQEDLDSYPALKTYINRTAHPNFKLGTALALQPYVDRSVIYRLANKNFDEIALGYEMKHGAIVKDDGSILLENVKTLLNTAEQAGTTVYGHTLCWHANQNAKYLNSKIQPLIIPGTSLPSWDLVSGNNFETADASNYQSNTNAVLSFTATGQGAGNTGRALKVTNSAVRANDWEAQLFFTFAPAAVVGEQYELTMDVRADNAASFPTQAHTAPGAYKHWDFFGAVNATTAWTKITSTITITTNTATCNTIAFNLGKTATSYYFDNITVKKYNAKGSGNAGYAYTFENPTVTNFWVAQVGYDVPVLDNNKEYTLKFAAKASVAGSIRAEMQSTADYSSNSFGTIALTQAWKEFELKTTMSKADRNRFIISFGDYAGKVLIDNVKLTAAGSTANIIANGDFEVSDAGWFGWGNGSTRGRSANGDGFGGALDQIIPKTPAQKDSIITAELTRWIVAMSAVTKNRVKAWDVVNEPMDDARPAELKTGVGRPTLAADEFFWQDYLGKDYAVKAFKLARQYGNPSDIHFINDYNLEYNLDKCRGIIEYVKYIESKGAKVDGIGTQMHIDINTDRTKIVDMLKLLAATGKLVKISELDIGLGGVQTPNATKAQYQAQADMYKFVIDKYFEHIPAAQRYGITIWSPTDSPANSSWRKGEPIGLWTEGYVRKLAYEAVAKALKENTK